MGTYATSTAIAVVGTALLLPAAMLPILAVLTRRYGALRGWPMLTSIGLLGSSVALAAFTIFPLPDPATLECTGGTLSSYWQTEWFASISLIGDAWLNVGFPAVLWSFALLQVALNVALFVPYGFFLHQVTRWRGLSVVGVGLATSALIEAAQGTGVFGLYPCPYRVFDVDDLLLNTLGAAVGVLISVAANRRAWTHPAPVHDLEPPTVPRRVIAAGIDLGLIVVVAGVAKAVWVKELDGAPHDLVFGLAALFLLTIVVPLLRRDRATVGQVIVNLAPTRGVASAIPASVLSILLRALLRWAPIVVFELRGLVAVVAAELIAGLSTRGTRSMAGVLARTTTRTKPAIAATEDTQPLVGGNMSRAVTRVGDTVRKPHLPQSDTVQRLVMHARAHGVTWAAEPLGVDDAGNDVWRFIPGDVDHGDPGEAYPDAVVTDIAARLRQWHDATLTFPRSPADVWWWPGKFPAEVICHVDFAPYNHVFRAGRFVGAIDFDLCYPGPRLWDLAYTAYRYVPLTPDADETTRERRLARLDAFLAAYAGGDPALTYAPSQLLGYVVPRLVAMAEWCDQQDSAARQRDGVMYRSHAQWIAAGNLGPADRVAVPDLS